MDRSKLINFRSKSPQSAFQENSRKKNNFKKLIGSDEVESIERFYETQKVFDQPKIKNEMNLQNFNRFGGRKMENFNRNYDKQQTIDYPPKSFLRVVENVVDYDDMEIDNDDISVDRRRFENNKFKDGEISKPTELNTLSRSKKDQLFPSKTRNANSPNEKYKDTQTQGTNERKRHKYIYISNSHPYKAKKTEEEETIEDFDDEHRKEDNQEIGYEQDELKTVVSFEIFESSAKRSNKKEKEKKAGHNKIKVNKKIN